MGSLCFRPMERQKNPHSYQNRGLVKSEIDRNRGSHNIVQYRNVVPRSRMTHSENLSKGRIVSCEPIRVKTFISPRVFSDDDDYLYQFMDFPFLSSISVIKWIMSSRMVFILRGPSGSGKTTIVHCLTDKFPNAVVCSVEHFFIHHDGSLNYDRSLLNEAEDFCRDAACRGFESGKSPLIIDNTHIHCSDYKYYIDLSRKFDYLVMIVVPKTPWRFELVKLAERSPRSEPIWEIEKSINQFETAIPLFFGWFLNDTDSDYILQIATDMLSLFMAFPEVRLDLAAACDLPELVSKEDLVDNWTIKSNRLHVTTKYCGNVSSPGCISYSKSGAVQEGLGQLFPIHIKGILLTPRTFSCHIQLAGPKQIQLWAGDDQEVTTTAKGTPSKSASLRRSSVLFYEKLNGPKTLRRPFGCRAHMTLMHSEDVTTVQSGLDQLQIIDLQLKNEKSTFLAEVDSGIITGWGQGRFYLELNFPIICPGLFTGQY